jgi:hypothetical protein
MPRIHERAIPTTICTRPRLTGGCKVIVSKETRELESVETGNQQESHYKEVFLNKVVNKTCYLQQTKP